MNGSRAHSSLCASFKLTSVLIAELAALAVNCVQPVVRNGSPSTGGEVCTGTPRHVYTRVYTYARHRSTYTHSVCTCVHTHIPQVHITDVHTQPCLHAHTHMHTHTRAHAHTGRLGGEPALSRPDSGKRLLQRAEVCPREAAGALGAGHSRVSLALLSWAARAD